MLSRGKGKIVTNGRRNSRTLLDALPPTLTKVAYLVIFAFSSFMLFLFQLHLQQLYSQILVYRIIKTRKSCYLIRTYVVVKILTELYFYLPNLELMIVV